GQDSAHIGFHGKLHPAERGGDPVRVSDAPGEQHTRLYQSASMAAGSGQLFLHRRQPELLEPDRRQWPDHHNRDRTDADSYRHRGSIAYPDGYSHLYPDSDSDSNRHGYLYSNSDSDGHGYLYSNS